MTFTILDDKGNVLYGLERVGADNANLARLSPVKPLGQLDVGERTEASWRNRYTNEDERYSIVRVS